VHGIYNLGAFIKKVEKLNGNKNSTIDDLKLQWAFLIHQG